MGLANGFRELSALPLHRLFAKELCFLAGGSCSSAGDEIVNFFWGNLMFFCSPFLGLSKLALRVGNIRVWLTLFLDVEELN